jgi:hypothetical protein
VVLETGIQGWKSAEDLQLRDELVVEWPHYTNLLKHSAICIKDQEDELSWSRNTATGMLTAKLGYATVITEDRGEERKWWWKVVWKLGCPPKIRIFIWLVLANKVLTWDNGQKRNWSGPGWCY